MSEIVTRCWPKCVADGAPLCESYLSLQRDYSAELLENERRSSEIAALKLQLRDSAAHIERLERCARVAELLCQYSVDRITVLERELASARARVHVMAEIGREIETNLLAARQTGDFNSNWKPILARLQSALSSTDSEKDKE